MTPRENKRGGAANVAQAPFAPQPERTNRLKKEEPLEERLGELQGGVKQSGQEPLASRPLDTPINARKG